MLLDAVMGKYDPLGAWLRRRNTAEVELGFADIERILGALLPKAATDESWWTGEDLRAPVQTFVRRAAGFEAVPDIRSERVRFLRAPAPAGAA